MPWFLLVAWSLVAGAEEVRAVPVASWEEPHHPIAVAVAADGERVAVSTLDSVRVMDVGSRQTVSVLPTAGATSLTFLEDGRRLLVGTPRRDLVLWHVDRGAPLRRDPLGDDAIEVTPGDRLVLASDPLRGRFTARTVEGRRVASVRIPEFVSAYAWTDEGRLATAVGRDRVEVRDVSRRGAPVILDLEIRGDDASPTAPRVAFSPDGQLLGATWNAEVSGVRVWETDDFSLVAQAPFPGERPGRVWFSGDSELLYVTGVHDGATPEHFTAVYDLTGPGLFAEVPSPLHPLPGHRAALRNERGSATLGIWDPDTLRDVVVMTFDDPVRTWAVSPSGRLVVADYGRGISVFDLVTDVRVAGAGDLTRQASPPTP